MRISPAIAAHAAAFFTASVWGLTFISTKVLLGHYTPLEVLLYRFCLCIAVMTAMKPVLFRHGGGWRTELLFICSGATGVSLYFFFENAALTLTYASNVSLIICTAPFFTGIVARVFLGESLYANFFTGFVVAFAGIACISFAGATTLGLNPKGDMLTICAALSWAFYSSCTRRLFSRGYPTFLATRRILLWGLITTAMVLPFQDVPLTPPMLTDPVTWVNFLFLRVRASAICFILWNHALNRLGAVKCTAYVYFSPVVTVIAAVVLLDERLTPLSVTGMALTLAGLVLSERHGNILAGFGRRRSA